MMLTDTTYVKIFKVWNCFQGDLHNQIIERCRYRGVAYWRENYSEDGFYDCYAVINESNSFNYYNESKELMEELEIIIEDYFDGTKDFYEVYDEKITDKLLGFDTPSYCDFSDIKEKYGNLLSFIMLEDETTIPDNQQWKKRYYQNLTELDNFIEGRYSDNDYYIDDDLTDNEVEFVEKNVDYSWNTISLIRDDESIRCNENEWVISVERSFRGGSEIAAEFYRDTLEKVQYPWDIEDNEDNEENNGNVDKA